MIPKAPDSGMEMPMEEKPAAPATTDTVPLKALAMPDEKEAMTPPAVGDEVTYTVTGKVTAVTGNQATIERKSINGQEIEREAEKQLPDEAGLQAEAEGLDQKTFGA